MRNFFEKLKTQNGATGTDVLISATMIVVTIGIVSMLYVNTSLQSRNITRTAGATRIATNLIENIDAISYTDFINQFGENNKLEYSVDAEDKVFNTKIPTGYSATIEAKSVYGSHTANSEKFDLVRQVKITVGYKTGNKDEKVEFSTVKQRQLIGECNSPAVSVLRKNILEDGINFYPVKYLQNAKAYIKTTEDDPEWYNYANKDWATVIVSRKDASNLFDVNGKLIGEINTTKSDSNYTQKAVWIPRYFSNKDTSNKNILFAFYANQDKGISTDNLVALDNISKLSYNSATDIDTNEWNNGNTSMHFGDETGKWTLIKSDNTLDTNDVFVAPLNNSQYGPCNLH